MNILIAGNYGAQNIGDELILEGMHRFFHDHFPNSQLTILSANPPQTTKSHKLPAIPKIPSGLRSWFKNFFRSDNPTTKALKNADFFILGGGGLFAGPENPANLIWYLQARAATKHRIPLLMLGQSIGKISRLSIAKIIKSTFQQAAFISVRDQASKTELQKLGITTPINIIPDFAFYLQPQSLLQTDVHQSFPEDSTEISKPQTLLIALRQMPNLPSAFFSKLQNFLTLLLTTQNWSLKFIDFQSGPHGDSSLHHQIIDHLPSKYRHKIQHIQHVASSQEIYQHYASAEAVLGMRLHSIITAIITRTPFIALNYAGKVQSLLQDLHLQTQLCSLDCEKLQDTFQEATKNTIALRKKLAQINKHQFQKFSQLSKSLFKIFPEELPEC